MNNYKVTDSMGDVTVTAIDEKDARRNFRNFRKCGDSDILAVELIRENVPATKAQERDALARIRAIVATLGPSSYVGTALDGCLTDAEVNIENDFGDSMKARWMDAERRVVEAVKETTAAKEELARCRQALIDAENNADWLSKQLTAAQASGISQADATDITDAISFIDERREVLEAAVAAAAGRIVDTAGEPESIAFVEAVRDHRYTKKRLDYCAALITRLAGIRATDTADTLSIQAQATAENAPSPTPEPAAQPEIDDMPGPLLETAPTLWATEDGVPLDRETVEKVLLAHGCPYPPLALAVAETESGFAMDAAGEYGEIGVM